MKTLGILIVVALGLTWGYLRYEYTAPGREARAVLVDWLEEVESGTTSGAAALWARPHNQPSFHSLENWEILKTTVMGMEDNAVLVKARVRHASPLTGSPVQENYRFRLEREPGGPFRLLYAHPY